MERVLLVEDDEAVRETVTMVLEQAGFAVTAVEDGLSAVAEGRSDGYDIVILDLMLPGLSGFEVCRELRTDTGVPIVMLTARTDAADVIRGLELGADDYVTKPFEPGVLTARIRAVLRRTMDDEQPQLRARTVEIDEAAYRAFNDGQELALTTIEFRLLTELVRHAGQALTREILLERVWGYDYLGDSRLVDMAIKRLRTKLGDEVGSAVPLISTVRGVGYRFEDEA